MNKLFLDFFINNSSDLTYEIDLTTKEIFWHKNINKALGYKENINLCKFDDFLTIIHQDDKQNLLDKILIKKDEEKKYELFFKIKDSFGQYQEWMDIYFKTENKIFGICKINQSLVINEKEEKTEHILDSTADLVFYKDLNFKYIGCNKAFCTFTGLKKEQIIGKDDFELFPKEYAELFRTMDLKMLETKQSRTNREWVVYPDGKKVLLLTQKSALLNKENEAYGLLGISRDITKEVEYENEIKRSKKRYEKLFQANKIPVLIICPKTGNIINANNSATKFYGYTKKEFKKLNISDINTLNKEEIQNEMNLAKKEKRDCFNFKHQTKDGRVIDVEVYSGPVNIKKEKFLYSVVFDISKRKQAQEKLKLAQTIYDNTKEGIFITDVNTNFLSANKAFEHITGYSEEEILSEKVSILKSNQHSKAFYESMWKSITQKGSWEGEVINKNKKGEFFPQWLTINAVYNDKNEVTNYIAVFTDFTKLKEQEQLLREKDQIMFQQSKLASMGEMLKNIAHQWRQPLSVITSSATGLKLKKEFGMLNDEDFEEFADGILKSSKYLSETIDDFSNYFKNSSHKEVFKTSEVIAKVIQLSDASLKNSDINIITNLDENIEAYGIKNELIQVVLNIINNSKDAFSNNETKNKKIEISTKIEYNNIVISIVDNAGGIDETIIDKVFEPYFTTKHQSQGTGIGLYMSKQIVEDRLEGSINVENIEEENQKGVEFKILIPTPK